MAHEHEESGAMKRLLLAADAFLFAAALVILAIVVLIGINVVTGALNQEITSATPAALAIQGGSLLLSLVAVGLGSVLAWRLHGRALTPMVGLFMAVGVVAGTPIAFAVFGGFAYVLSRIPIGGDGPPWLAIGVLAAAVIALVIMPLVDAVRDTRGAREHTRLDMLRWVALAIVVAIAVIALPALGAMGMGDGELGEAGLFMVPFSLAAAMGVLGGDLYCTYRDRRSATAVKPV
jgi:hypothetical protein